MQTQLEMDLNEFSSLHENSKFPKLSLIFNAMGLSSDTIRILQDYTGAKFNDDDLNDSITYYGIHDFKEQKQLFYIRHMMQQKLISTDHAENCAVCICETPLDLKNLLLEREIYVPIDFSFIDDFQLNGPRFLFINYSDCKRFMLNAEQIEQLMELKEQLHSLHLYDEIRYKPKNKVYKSHAEAAKSKISFLDDDDALFADNSQSKKPASKGKDIFGSSGNDDFFSSISSTKKPATASKADSLDLFGSGKGDDLFSSSPSKKSSTTAKKNLDDLFSF